MYNSIYRMARLVAMTVEFRYFDPEHFPLFHLFFQDVTQLVIF